MKRGRAETLRRTAAFKRFEKSNPPRMPADFSHRDYKRVVSYARTAFRTGWNSGQNDERKRGDKA